MDKNKESDIPLPAQFPPDRMIPRIRSLFNELVIQTDDSIKSNIVFTDVSLIHGPSCNETIVSSEIRRAKQAGVAVYTEGITFRYQIIEQSVRRTCLSPTDNVPTLLFMRIDPSSKKIESDSFQGERDESQRKFWEEVVSDAIRDVARRMSGYY
ncbi:hypothetical protein A2Y99_03175 [Candidatus Gottesmanbacteria bacterium RBG_13_37_7]|uniref:Uncharacterized protein n=1 Tax=Candidatus Gottesmanbacteria bacterium RBG_13_37_7 TaxID=1798369 RepID=A0A1F5YGD2_9BACT|nr:MAG: hypothetical protein A2Y99_03175 [Candidatus Gottesmanbacteria bacterium RBG_13_37_7]